MAPPQAGGDFLKDAAELVRGGASRPLALAGLAAFVVSFDRAVLVLALPAIAADFRTPVPDLGRLGSALALGTVAAVPIAMQADRVGRRRLLVLAVAGFSLANLASAWSPSLGWLAASRVVPACLWTGAGRPAHPRVRRGVAPPHRGLVRAGLQMAP